MMCNKKHLLFITRKYPPITGGMENFSFSLYNAIRKKWEDSTLVALGKKQIHLLWYFPYTVFYTIFHAHAYQSMIVGDSLLCFLGCIAHVFSPKTRRIVIVYGLDILFENKLYQLYLKLFLKHSADLFVCISSATEAALRKRGIKNTVIITPGIDVDSIDTQKDS